MSRWPSVRPGPVSGLGFVDAILMCVFSTLDLLVQESFLSVAANLLQSWHPVHNVHGEAEPVDIVVDGQLQRRVDAALFFIAAHMNIAVIGAAIGQTMNELRIAVEI